MLGKVLISKDHIVLFTNFQSFPLYSIVYFLQRLYKQQIRWEPENNGMKNVVFLSFKSSTEYYYK